MDREGPAAGLHDEEAEEADDEHHTRNHPFVQYLSQFRQLSSQFQIAIILQVLYVYCVLTQIFMFIMAFELTIHFTKIMRV